ncbi:MAG: hypothetical protein DMG61_04460 [Acidobacteria bacterium]|nr:MAG: hypothetical protein DMG61_04460 [Acidobacteriota bacterium]PYY18045.1 MAG: hypothetical protein DMG60_09680 [Acidobacteriota bacterium]
MGRLKSLFGIFVVAAVVYLLWKMMPPYIQAYQFQEELQSISRNNEYSPLDENAIRGEVRKQIAEIGVPVNPELVSIAKGGGDCIIGVNYTVHIDAMFRPFDMDFHPAAKNGTKIDPIPNRIPQ